MQAGLLIADRFLIRSQLGRGGMGSVWLAQHTQLDVPCAVKFIEGPNTLDADLRRRFTQEAKAAALLRSPHVVQIFDAGTWEGTPYLAMELLEGEELSKRLERAGRLGPAECVAIAEQVARALVKAHAAGIIHRDLKPDNIFLVQDEGRELVKILDFGIAKRTNINAESLSKNPATKHGAFLGTPYYMSPEQTRDSRGVDFRADLWSFAVIVFECLVGRRPFQGQLLTDILLKIGVDPLPVPSEIAPDLPPAFDAWWQKAAEREPERRFGSAREMIDALAVSLGVSTAGERASAADAPAPAKAAAKAPARTPPPREATERAPFASTTQAGSLALATSPRSDTAPRRSRRGTTVVAFASVVALGGAGLAMSGRLWGGKAAGVGAGPSAPAAVSHEARRPVVTPVPDGERGNVGGAPAVKASSSPAVTPTAEAKEAPASAPPPGRSRPDRDRSAKKKSQGDDGELGF